MLRSGETRTALTLTSTPPDFAVRRRKISLSSRCTRRDIFACLFFLPWILRFKSAFKSREYEVESRESGVWSAGECFEGRWHSLVKRSWERFCCVLLADYRHSVAQRHDYLLHTFVGGHCVVESLHAYRLGVVPVRIGHMPVPERVVGEDVSSWAHDGQHGLVVCWIFPFVGVYEHHCRSRRRASG